MGVDFTSRLSLVEQGQAREYRFVDSLMVTAVVLRLELERAFSALSSFGPVSPPECQAWRSDPVRDDSS